MQWPSTRCGRIALTSFPRHWKRIQGRITLVDGRHDQYSIRFPRSHKTRIGSGFCKQSVTYLSARAFGSITQCIALSGSPKAGALVGWFGGEERLESFISDVDGAVDA